MPPDRRKKSNQNSSTITLSDKNQINNLIISPVVNYGYHQTYTIEVEHDPTESKKF